MALAVHALQEQINAAKLNLKAVDENIKKITGRDPNAPRYEGDGDSKSTFQKRNVTARNDADSRGGGASSLPRRTILGRRVTGPNSRNNDKEDQPPNKTRPGAVFSRLTRGGANGTRPGIRRGDRRVIVSRRQSGDDKNDDDEEELEVKPSVQSSVVTAGKKITKTELINAQNVDEKGKARNRRMFGVLMGTLSRFQDDTKHGTPQMKQAKLQKRIEERLEEEYAENRKKVFQERKVLYTERRMQRKKIELLEQKVAITAEQEKWEENWLMKKSFIMTKAKPELFYAPVEHNSKSKKALEDTQKTIQERIDLHKKSVQESLQKIDDEIKSLETRGTTDHKTDEQKELGDATMDEDKENGSENEGNEWEKGKSGNDDSDREDEVDLSKIPAGDIKVENQTQSDGESDSGSEGGNKINKNNGVVVKGEEEGSMNATIDGDNNDDIDKMDVDIKIKENNVTDDNEIQEVLKDIDESATAQKEDTATEQKENTNVGEKDSNKLDTTTTIKEAENTELESKLKTLKRQAETSDSDSSANENNKSAKRKSETSSSASSSSSSSSSSEDERDTRKKKMQQRRRRRRSSSVESPKKRRNTKSSRSPQRRRPSRSPRRRRRDSNKRR